MGHVRVKARVWNIEDPDRVKEVELLVDTGSTYTVLPRSLLMELGVRPSGRRRFRVADGRVIERDVGIVGIEIKGVATYTLAVFGDEGTYLLGVVTLEELGFEVDPATGELRPMELLMMVKEGLG